MTTPQLFTIDHCHAGQRLDKALGELVSGLGTRGAKRFAINGQVTVNGKPSRPNNRLEEGDIIAFEETKIKIVGGTLSSLISCNIRTDIFIQETTDACLFCFMSVYGQE